MSIRSITLVEGDTTPDITCRLTSAVSPGSTETGPQNLTDATIVARLKRTGDDPPVALEVDCEIVGDPLAGVVKIPLGGSEFDTSIVATYNVEFVVTFADDSQQTFPVFAKDVWQIIVRAQKTAD